VKHERGYQYQVWVESGASGITNSPLRRFRLLLADDGDIGNEDVNKVGLPHSFLKLADGMDERTALDISHGATFSM